VVVVIAVVVATRGSKTVAAKAGGTGATDDYGFVVGKASAPAKLIAYEDFQCPICDDLETTYGTLMAKNIADGKLSIEYRPVTFLDRSSLNQYSSRALNAAVCVAKYGGITDFKKYHDYLFAHQPKEDTAGPENSALISDATSIMGKAVPAVASCINGGSFDAWGTSATNEWSKTTSKYPSGESTPTLVMNGTLVPTSEYTSGAATFQAFIDKSAGTS
jgi:protein-disulfide isomerase